MLNEKILEDISLKYGFKNIEFVNKDFYGVQVIKTLSQMKSDFCDLIFTGGTCIAKAYNLIERMSEDIDIKIVLKDTTISNNSIRKKLSALKKQLKNELQKISTELKDENIKADHDNRHIVFDIPYPTVSRIGLLRGNIKLELTQFPIRLKPISKSISSFAAIEQKESPEVESIPCVDAVEILAEKIVSLVRRTCVKIEGEKQYFDPTIVRHIYDIYKIHSNINTDGLKSLVKEIVKQDAEHFQSWHPKWSANPKEMTLEALKELKKEEYEELYANYTESMIYSKDYPKYKTALKEISSYINNIFENI
jgi:predicted nucleotidyltransferase component of viral defense system